MKRIKETIWMFLLVAFIATLALHISLVGSAESSKVTFASTNVSGYIMTNTTWTVAGSPYIVVGDLIVDANVFLTIKPGVVVEFTVGTNLLINGGLIAQGNSTHKISFTSNKTAPKAGDWGTIRVRGQANISYATINYAVTGVSFVQTGSLVDCWFDHLFISSNVYGITMEAPNNGYSNLYLDSVEIVNNTNTGIYFGELASPSFNTTYIRNSVLSQNGFGIRTIVYGSAHLHITSSIISYNVYGGIYLVASPSSASIHHSDFIGNGPFDISADINAHVDATLNWWDTTNGTLIAKRLSGPVDYVPFLNSSSRTLYSLTVDPFFYDNTGTAPIHPSSWSIRFPNDTIRTVSSPVTYNHTQIGKYSIVSVIWKGAKVIPETAPTALLTSDMLWSPSIILLLPTSLPLSLSSSTSYVGFKVEIYGNLTCNEVGLLGTPILLSYSVTRGESWNDITLVNTTSDGGYSAVWMPSATGNYLLRATWSGNATYPGTSTLINLAVIPFKEQNVFSVTSNSTVSELAFNSTSRELSFTVTGPSGTTGYVNVYIAKTLADNITDVKVHLDGDQLNYAVTSLDDSWLLHFTYRHSTHKVTINLGRAFFIPPQLITPLSLGIIAVALTIATILLLFKIRRGTPPTILNGFFRKLNKSKSLQQMA